MARNGTIDWSGMSARRNQARLRGTRMPVEAIVDNYDHGVSVAEIAQQFEVPPDCVEAILARVAPPV
jgi:hypothetical protein